MQHSNVSYPVIGVIYVDGYPVNLRRKGGGNPGRGESVGMSGELHQNAQNGQI